MEVSERHPWYGLSHNTILEKFPGMGINLTFSELKGDVWVIGWEEDYMLECKEAAWIQNLLMMYMCADS